MRVIVLLNAGAGKAADPPPAAVEGAFRAVGVDADVRPTSGPQLPAAARDAVGAAAGGAFAAVVAAGGDGTVSGVAAAVAGTGVPLGVLPVGTLNHFAKDLGLPLDLAGAAAIIAGGLTDGRARAVDAGEVNGRTFINNAGIGLYPRIVSRRDRQRQRLGRGKWLAMAVAAAAVVRRYPLVDVILNTPAVAVRRRTPFVFVGNNPYQIEGLNLGVRPRLDTGQLCAYFANRPSRFGLLLLAVRALLGRLNQSRDFDTLAAAELSIEARRKRLRVALDGEVTRLSPPLRFRSRPGALRVLAP